MELFQNICYGASFGIIVGFLFGSFKFVKKKEYSQEKQLARQKVMNKLSNFLKYMTALFLLLGLVWCIYFLVLGLCVPQKVDYANNMAELIVAVLTVISIIFAFVEFVKRS